MTEGPSETASLPTQAARRVSRVLEDAIHFTQSVAAGATSAVVHSPDYATRALEDARHLGEEATHQAENVVHSIEHWGEEAVHQAQDVREVIAHTPEHAARALEDARHFAEEAVHHVEHVAEDAVHGTEGAVHSLEHIAEDVVHSIEHWGEEAVHKADDVRSAIAHTPQHASRVLQEAKSLAGGAVHQVQEAVQTMEKVPERAIPNFIYEENRRLKAQIEDANQRAGESRAHTIPNHLSRYSECSRLGEVRSLQPSNALQ